METNNTQDREHITKDIGNHQERRGLAMAESRTAPNIEDDTSTTEGKECQVLEQRPESPDRASTSDDERRKNGAERTPRQPQQPLTGDIRDQPRDSGEEMETNINGYTEMQLKVAGHDDKHDEPAPNSSRQELETQLAANGRSHTEVEKDREAATSGNDGNNEDTTAAESATTQHFSAIEVQEKLNKCFGKVQLEMTRLNRKLFQKNDSETITLRHQMANLSRAIEMVGAVKLDNTEELRRQHRIEIAVERERNRHLGAQIHHECIKRDELKEKFKAKEAAKHAEFTRKLNEMKRELRRSKNKIHDVKESHQKDMKVMSTALSSLADARLGLTTPARN